VAKFRDHFSRGSDDYARFRPRYPDELFAYLAGIAPRRELAWDCGTGSGQAAVGLAGHFRRVVATDASAEQLRNATAHERVEYRAGRAEDVDLGAGSVDLVTVAAAAHWFDLPEFYRAVNRVSVAGGVLALWTYHLPVIDPAMDRVLLRHYSEVLEGHWPERFHYVVEHYRTLPFPFEEVGPPEFDMRASWNLAELSGFIESWSASRRYREAHGRSSLESVREALVEAWGDPDRSRAIRWPLYLRVGRIA